MKAVWCFVLFLGFYSNKIALGTEIRCDVRYEDKRQQCRISEIEKEGINQEIDLPISLNDTQTIPFSENSFGNILSNLFKALPELTVLYIDSPLIHSPLNLDNTKTDVDTFEWMTAFDAFGALNQTNNLTTLTIHTPLRTIPKEIFSYLYSLQGVDFFKCNITNIEDFAFADAKQLTGLILGHNTITEIRQNSFAGLSKLETLILNYNQISRIEDGALNLPKLHFLSLKSNQLTTLSDTFFNLLPSLKYIELSRNKLESIGKSFHSLQKVVDVYLDRNQIVDIDLKEFAKLPALKRLHLSNSGFDWTAQTDVTDNFITSVNSNLNWLDVSYNNITDSSFINKLKMFRKLKTLAIDGNPFEEITWTSLSVHEMFPELSDIFAYKVKLNCEHLKNLHKEFEKGGIDFSYSKSDCTA